jgi:putative thioredoxin
MSDQPLTTGGLRGAIDLTALRSQPPSGAPSASAGGSAAGAAGGAGAGAPGANASSATAGVAGRTGVVVEGTDTNFQEIANASVGVPMLLVLWAVQVPESLDYLDTVVAVAGSYEGRFQVVSVNVEQNPTLLRAFQVQTVPVTIGLIQGQPVPMFAGIQPDTALRPVLDEFLGLAVQHGVTGRVDIAGSGAAQGEEVEEQLPPLHQEAYDAIERGDLEGAATAYQQALKQNPADADAELGLAQVGLMQRTDGADLQAARAAAAKHPTDVAAQGLVADLDVLGGHVEDAFLRLLDLVRATAGEEREQAKNHLLQLFAVVGSHDERVRKARTALMSALF